MVKLSVNFHLLLPFFLPLTWFSKLLILWLRIEDVAVLVIFVGFAVSVGKEVAFDGLAGGRDFLCCACTYFLSASVNEKAGCAVVAGATGIIGTPRNFFTFGVLITGENEANKSIVEINHNGTHDNNSTEKKLLEQNYWSSN